MSTLNVNVVVFEFGWWGLKNVLIRVLLQGLGLLVTWLQSCKSPNLSQVPAVRNKMVCVCSCVQIFHQVCFSLPGCSEDEPVSVYHHHRHNHCPGEESPTSTVSKASLRRRRHRSGQHDDGQEQQRSATQDPGHWWGLRCPWGKTQTTLLWFSMGTPKLKRNDGPQPKAKTCCCITKMQNGIRILSSFDWPAYCPVAQTKATWVRGVIPDDVSGKPS